MNVHPALLDAIASMRSRAYRGERWRTLNDEEVTGWIIDMRLGKRCVKVCVRVIAIAKSNESRLECRFQARLEIGASRNEGAGRGLDFRGAARDTIASAGHVPPDTVVCRAYRPPHKSSDDHPRR